MARRWGWAEDDWSDEGWTAAEGTPEWERGLAMWRRRQEVQAVDDGIADIERQLEHMDEEARGDFWERQVEWHSRGVKGADRDSAIYRVIGAYTRGTVGKAGGGGGPLEIREVRRGDREDGEPVVVPTSVLKQVREAGQKMTKNRPHNERVALRLLEIGAEAAGWRTGAAAEEPEWAARVYSETVFDTQVRRCRVEQGVGSDGFRCVAVRWADRWMRLGYLRDLREVAMTQVYPGKWKEWLVLMIEKPGRDKTLIKNLRDLWLVPHGWKLITGMNAREYERAYERKLPTHATGFRQGHNALEALMAVKLAGSVMGGVEAQVWRAYVDLDGFFMHINRLVLLELELAMGVVDGVPRGMKALQDAAVGRINTRYGLTELFKMESGCGQGCNASPVRSLADLLPAQLTVARLVPGVKFPVRGDGARAVMQQGWFADDGTLLAESGRELQMGLDAIWAGGWCSGQKLGVNDKGTKTAYVGAAFTKGGWMDQGATRMHDPADGGGGRQGEGRTLQAVGGMAGGRRGAGERGSRRGRWTAPQRGRAGGRGHGG